MKHQIQYGDLQGYKAEQIFASSTQGNKQLIISTYCSLKRQPESTYIIRKKGIPEYSTNCLKQAVDIYNSL